MRPFRLRVAAIALLALFLAAGCLGAPAATPAASAAAPVAGGDCLASVKGIDLQNATIAALQDALASGRITSVDLVDAYAVRIAAYDIGGPKLNSVQVINPNARAEAIALDAERAAGHVRGPLHGIPILLKDNIGTTEMATTAGSIALAKNVPAKNATITDKLAASGMIILGKTHLSEFANWVDLSMPNGYSSLGGQVVNAYTGGDPSGSSSGSGVAGSMAFAAITIGTETSGSILGPSDANSLVGVKPTTGLVSRAGIIPLAANFDTPGPMGRHVADVAAVLSSIAGPDARDKMTAASGAHAADYLAGLKPDALKGVRLGYDPDSTDAIFEQAKKDLSRLGAVLVPVQKAQSFDQPGAAELGLIPNEFKAGINDYLAHEAGPGLPVKTLDDIILYNNQHTDKVKYGQNLLIASDSTPGLYPLADAGAMPVIDANRASVDAMLSQNGVAALVGPSLAFVSSGAAAGYPTVIVPAGYNGHNPEGLSFFGAAWSEPKLLAYAYAYEQGTMRREPPTVITPTLLDGVCAAAK